MGSTGVMWSSSLLCVWEICGSNPGPRFDEFLLSNLFSSFWYVGGQMEVIKARTKSIKKRLTVYLL